MQREYHESDRRAFLRQEYKEWTIGDPDPSRAYLSIRNGDGKPLTFNFQPAVYRRCTGSFPSARLVRLLLVAEGQPVQRLVAGGDDVLAAIDREAGTDDGVRLGAIVRGRTGGET